MNEGSLFRQLRQDKLVTMEQLSIDTGLSQGFISKFERNQSDISISNFRLLLMALNVSEEEFWIGLRNLEISNSLKSDDLNIARIRAEVPFMAPFFQVYSLSNSKDVLPYLKKAQETFRKFPTRKNRFVYLFYQSIKALLEEPIDTTTLHESQLPIVHYLQQVDEWGLYECFLFELFTTAIDPNLMLPLLKIGLRKSRSLAQNASFSGMSFQILMSAFTSLLARKKFDLAQEVYAFFLQEPPVNASEVIMKDFLGGWLLIMKEQTSKGAKKCQIAIQSFKSLDMVKTANDLQDILNQLLKDKDQMMVLLMSRSNTSEF